LKTWLIDTGPLVALLVGDDSQHVWAVEQSRHAPATVLTCEAVISEALFLLKREGYEGDDLFELVEVGFLRTDFEFHAERSHIRELLKRYREPVMSFADACLVRMAELHPDACVWTLDRGFQFYRKHRRHTLSLVAPF